MLMDLLNKAVPVAMLGFRGFKHAGNGFGAHHPADH